MGKIRNFADKLYEGYYNAVAPVIERRVSNFPANYIGSASLETYMLVCAALDIRKRKALKVVKN
jgi:hypothetical protein